MLLILFLFIIVTEALSCEFRTGFLWELLYTDDPVTVAESIGELKVRLKNCKDGLEEKGAQGKHWEDQNLLL